MGEAVRLEVDDGVAVITLDRPEVRNAYNGAMGRELDDAYRACDGDDAVRAVVVTGAPPAFCSGADLSPGADTFAPVEGAGFSAAATAVRAWDVGKVVVAAVNGPAIGLGLTLALQCDLRVFARNGRYGVVQVRRGMMGDGYSHWTLPRLAGMGAAAEILLTGRTFDGDEAARLGLCNRVVDDAEVLPTASSIARDVADHAAPLSVALSKRLLWETWGRDAAGVERRETELHRVLMAEPDAREGVAAFLERRPPRWTGSVAAHRPD